MTKASFSGCRRRVIAAAEGGASCRLAAARSAGTRCRDGSRTPAPSRRMEIAGPSGSRPAPPACSASSRVGGSRAKRASSKRVEGTAHAAEQDRRDVPSRLAAWFDGRRCWRASAHRHDRADGARRPDDARLVPRRDRAGPRAGAGRPWRARCPWPLRCAPNRRRSTARGRRARSRPQSPRRVTEDELRALGAGPPFTRYAPDHGG